MCPGLSRGREVRALTCQAGRPQPFGQSCLAVCSSFGFSMFSSARFVSPIHRLSCQADGTWNFNTVTNSGSIAGDGGLVNPCNIAETCPSFTLPMGAVLGREVAACTSGEPAPKDTVCYVRCPYGYRMMQSRVPVYRCMSNGRWSDIIPSKLPCIDVTPPVFDGPCPRNHTFFTPPCSIRANVSFEEPNATDNSGESVMVKGPKGAQRLVMPETLYQGHHERLYKVADSTGNVQSCMVNIDVRVRTCPRPPGLSDGGFLRVASETCGNRYGSTMSFVCAKGTRLIGASELSCLQNGSWSHPNPRCERVPCADPITPPNSRVVCSALPPSSLPSRQLCTLWCDSGFRMSPPDPPLALICYPNGTLQGVEKFSRVNCIDISPPSFSACPTGFTIPLEQGSNTARVTWERPRAQDNNGIVNVTGPPNSAELASGAELFTYIAMDAAGLTARCSFEVTVIDMEPPTVMNCPSEVNVIQSNTLPVRVDYQQPLFDDNVGIVHTRNIQWYSRYRITNSLAYEWGYTEINFQALDRAGNQASCSVKFELIQSTECPELTTPPNADLICSADRSRCTLACRQGFYFLQTGTQSPLVYTCQSSGMWNHSTMRDENPYLPVCTQRETADQNRWEQSGNFILRVPGNCSNLLLTAINNKFNTLFRTSNLFKACLADGTVDCSVSRVTSSCSPSDDLDQPSRRRRRRQADEEGDTTNDVSLSISMSATAGGTHIPDFLGEFNATSTSGLWSEDNMILSLPDNLTATLDTDRSRLGGFVPVCAEGQEAVRFICVQCPPGTFRDPRSSTCQSCRKGAYQDMTGQSTCKGCPAGMSTRATGAFSVDQCEVRCRPGTYSYTGLGPDCLACSVGTYQEDTGSRGCCACPGNTTTSGTGETSPSSCIAPADVTSPRPTTPDDGEIFHTAVTESNNQDDNTTPVSINIKTTPAIVISAEATTENTNVHKVPTPGRKTDNGSKSKGLVAGACIGLLIILVIFCIIAVVMYRRRRTTIPMSKFTNLIIEPSEDADHDNDYAVMPIGKYQPMQEMDSFDLEHLTAYGDTPAAEKRSSFSNALYESQDEPKSDLPTQVWTTFDVSAESQA